jgi:MipA family protein
MAHAPALATESPLTDPQETTTAQYVFGASLTSSPSYSGAGERKVRLRPSWAVQWGRLRLSTAEAADLLGHAPGNTGSGMMADLAQQGQWSLSAGLRIDNGREASSNTNLIGTTNIAPTIRGKVAAGYRFTPEWSASANLSQDLLGRRGGMSGSLDAGWRIGLAHGTVWSVGAGVGVGNHLFMNTLYGVPAGAAIAPAGFSAKAGVRDAHASISMRTPIAPQWFWYGSAGLTRQLGDAARSPLTLEPQGYVITSGVAYRCCKP